MAIKLTFSGHESFQCRHLWLKKGYDYVKQKKSFNDDDAVVYLGVGKNMVSAIKFWMKAFNILTQDDKLTEFAHRLLADDGYDPYIEDEATLWLLHYQLVKKGFASTYSIIFNELRKIKVEWTKDNFNSYLKNKAEVEKSFQYNKNTIGSDFYVFTKMYLRLDDDNKDKEDAYSGLLSELGLVKKIQKRIKNNEGKEQLIDFFYIENTERTEIPSDIILYAMLDNDQFEASINLSSIEMNLNSAGNVFAINKTGLLNKIESLVSKHKYIVFNDQAGIKELQFKKKPSAFDILDKYYHAN